MKLAVIGNGAISGFVQAVSQARGHDVVALILRPERLGGGSGQAGGPARIASAADLPDDVEHVVDCAGHSGLVSHGTDVLRAGLDLTTVSIGALADRDLADRLDAAARNGGARLRLATGAIGALDCLRAARVGRLGSVRYIGRKPPVGWQGSPAEDVLDLGAMEGEARTHFIGTAREAAISYPKNANVAAAVALAGIGFEETQVELIADPAITRNVHEIHAEGDFGTFEFRISGQSLPDNPRSSALAAMSAISALELGTEPMGF